MHIVVDVTLNTERVIEHSGSCFASAWAILLLALRHFQCNAAVRCKSSEKGQLRPAPVVRDPLPDATASQKKEAANIARSTLALREFLSVRGVPTSWVHSGVPPSEGRP